MEYRTLPLAPRYVMEGYIYIIGSPELGIYKIGSHLTEEDIDSILTNQLSVEKWIKSPSHRVGRPRIHKSNAAKQRAYRQRKVAL